MQRTQLKQPPGTNGSNEKDDVPLAQLVNRSNEPVGHSPTPSADHASEGPPPQEDLADLMAAMPLLLQLQWEQMALSTPPVATAVQHPRDPLRLSMDVSKYTGYSDSQSVATFIDSLRDYQVASGITDEMVATRLLAAAFPGSAAMWRR